MESQWNRAQISSVLWRQQYYLVVKRMIDVATSLIALLFLFPIMAITALLIKLDSPGPALFIQTRIGKGGRAFRMFKFRTMRNKVNDYDHQAFMRAFVRGEIGQDEDGETLYKPFTSSEVTRIGRFLRNTSLDELPQLFNVLQGDMSLVGPRPNVPWEVQEYKSWHMERLDVLPGITGLAQVNGRSGINFDTIVKYDVEYIRNRNLGLDLQILWQTFVTVLGGDGVE